MDFGGVTCIDKFNLASETKVVPFTAHGGEMFVRKVRNKLQYTQYTHWDTPNLCMPRGFCVGHGNLRNQLPQLSTWKFAWQFRIGARRMNSTFECVSFEGTVSCWFAAGNENWNDPTNHPSWFPQWESPSASFPTVPTPDLSHSLPIAPASFCGWFERTPRSQNPRWGENAVPFDEGNMV